MEKMFLSRISRNRNQILFDFYFKFLSLGKYSWIEKHMEKGIKILLFALIFLTSFNIQVQEEISFTVQEEQPKFPGDMVASVILRRKDIPQKVANENWLELAEFPGGSPELTKYIRENITNNYKEQPRHMPVNTVWTKNSLSRLVITGEGQIRQLQTIRKNNRILEKNNLHILSQIPDEKTAKKCFENTTCCITFPINWKDIFLEIQNMKINKKSIYEDLDIILNRILYSCRLLSQ